jgi:hypothetical protein
VLTDEHGLGEAEWDWVQGLIREVEREAERDEFAKQLFQWDLATRAFRRMEARRFANGEPSSEDLEHHAICLHMLLTIGRALAARVRDFKATELLVFRVTREQVEGYVADLEQDYREWHHGHAVADVDAARMKVLGGPA